DAEAARGNGMDPARALPERSAAEVRDADRHGAASDVAGDAAGLSGEALARRVREALQEEAPWHPRRGFAEERRSADHRDLACARRPVVGRFRLRRGDAVSPTR